MGIDSFKKKEEFDHANKQERERERERGPKWAPTRALAHLPCKSTNRARFCNFPAFEQYLLIAEVAIGPNVTEPLWNSNVARFRNLYC